MTNIIDLTAGRIGELLERRGIDWAREVPMLVEVGSTVHGIAQEGRDDLDLTAVRFEPWQEFVTGPPRRQSMQIRTAEEGARSMPGDIDLNVYTVRKFVHLASKGNPSILTALYSPSHSKLSDWVFEWVDGNALRELVRSARAGQAYLGYMRQQLERWQGKRGQKGVSRPELVEAYGYDTKYAGHIIRLGLQGTEYLNTGNLTLPMPAEARRLVRRVRNGEVSESYALGIAGHVEALLKRSIEKTELPPEPDLHKLAEWTADHYETYFWPAIP